VGPTDPRLYEAGQSEVEGLDPVRNLVAEATRAFGDDLGVVRVVLFMLKESIPILMTLGVAVLGWYLVAGRAGEFLQALLGAVILRPGDREEVPRVNQTDDREPLKALSDLEVPQVAAQPSQPEQEPIRNEKRDDDCG
jgi:hypothetical protein